MFDSFGPGTGFGTGAFMTQVMQDLMQGAASYEDWSRAAVEVATSAQASYRHHLEDTDEANMQALAHDLDAIGRQAQRLAVIAENRNYGDEQVDLMRRLDRLCLRYTNGAPNSEKGPKGILHDELPDLVREIFDTLDRGTDAE